MKDNGEGQNNAIFSDSLPWEKAGLTALNNPLIITLSLREQDEKHKT